MAELSLALALSAFVAGLLMFLAPCTLPLVPAYLAFISGVKPKELKDPTTKDQARREIIINSLAFVIGFSIIFIAFGVLAGFFGSFIGQFRSLLTQIGGGFIIIFGLMMLNVIKFAPLQKERRLKLPSVFTPGNPVSAFLIGSTFALGWTPCVGPVLASVLLLASTEATAFSGGLLLAIFSLGLSVPFILTALLYARASALIARYSGVTRFVSVVGGVFLILIGLLLVTDNFGLTVEYGYRVFEWLGIDGLFKHL